jgi:hypothetical protein
MKKLMQLVRSSMLWLLILPYAVYYTGVASNQLVLFVNHDKFPVMYSPTKEAIWLAAADKELQENLHGKHPDLEEAEVIRYSVEHGMIDETHCIMTGETHLNALADIFDFHSEGIQSIGDLSIDLGHEMKDTLPFIWVALILYKESKRASEKA